MTDSKKSPTPLEIELAALGDLPSARQREVEDDLSARGELHLLEDLRARDQEFHRTHPPEAMLARIAHKASSRALTVPAETSARARLVPRRPRQVLVALAALLAIVIGALILTRSAPKHTPRRAPEMRSAGPTSVMGHTRGCDMSRDHPEHERVLSTTSAWGAHMTRCHEQGHTLLNPTESVQSVPAVWRYACEQGWHPSCLAQGQLLYYGIELFTMKTTPVKSKRPPLSQQDGLESYERACQLGNDAACCELGNILVIDHEHAHLTQHDPEYYFARAEELNPKWCVRQQ